MPISNELIDQMLKDCHSPEDLLGESGLLKQPTQKLAERALEAEMAMHLGYVKHDQNGNNSGSDNGTSTKTVRSQEGELELNVPRDRNGTFKVTKRARKSLTGLMTVLFSCMPEG